MLKVAKTGILATLCAGAVFLATPAHAAPEVSSIVWNPQNTALPGYTTATVIQPFNTAQSVQDGSTYQPISVAGQFSESTSVPTGNKRVAYFNTPRLGMDGQYIGLVNGGTYDITLASPMQLFSFVFNSLDNADKVTLTFADATTLVILGSDILNGGKIIGLDNSQIPAAPDDWGRVSYDMQGGPGILSVAFHSGSGTLYLDSIAFATPEPGTWAMLILGFGLAGWQLRSSKRRTKLALA